MRTIHHAVALAIALGLGGCDLTRAQPAPDASPGPADALSPPRGDVVPSVGGPATLDLACWNIENFPMTGVATIDVADLITSLDLDVIVVEEVTSEAAWNELVARLPTHEGVLSPHVYADGTYQKIGILYRTGVATVTGAEPILTGNLDFPRPPFHAHLHYDDGTHRPIDLDLVGLHLKAGVTDDDHARRRGAVIALDAWINGRADTGYALLGDWNQELDDAEVWAPIAGAPARYTIRSSAAAAAGASTYLPAHSMIDHIVTTAALAPVIGDTSAIVPPLGQEYNAYYEVSDHQPVVLRIPLAVR
jgi:hypothetical protein